MHLREMDGAGMLGREEDVAAVGGLLLTMAALQSNGTSTSSQAGDDSHDSHRGAGLCWDACMVYAHAFTVIWLLIPYTNTRTGI